MCSMCGLKKEKKKLSYYLLFILLLKFHLKDFYLSWLEDGIVEVIVPYRKSKM